jgi:hypothetical protein
VDLIEALRKRIGPDVIPSILDAGFNFDVVDRASLEKATVEGKYLAIGAGRYRAVVVPNTQRIPAGVRRKIDEFTKSGGGIAVFGETDAGSVLSERLSPDATFEAQPTAAGGPIPAPSSIGSVHRRAGTLDAYFVANTSNLPAFLKARFHVSADSADWWDPVSGTSRAIPVKASADSAELFLDLPEYGSGFVVFGTPPGPAGSEMLGVTSVYTSARFRIGDQRTAADVQLPHNWAATTGSVNVSGVAHYDFEAHGPHAPEDAADGAWLDFGDSAPVPESNPARNGMRAWLDAPVRDAAVVYVNGVRAGAAWCPPYKVALGSLLHPGTNSIRIDVANTAMNAMSGMALPDYRLLNLRYGLRFEPQDMDRIAAQPSGLLTPRITISWSRTHSQFAR